MLRSTSPRPGPDSGATHQGSSARRRSRRLHVARNTRRDDDRSTKPCVCIMASTATSKTIGVRRRNDYNEIGGMQSARCIAGVRNRAKLPKEAIAIRT